MATSKKQQAAIAVSMKKAGKTPKILKKAKEGVSVKKTCPPDCGATNVAKPQSGWKNLLTTIGFGTGIGLLAKYANSDKATERANSKADERDAKRLERKSKRREKKGFQPISTPSFGKYKKGGTLKTKKK